MLSFVNKIQKDFATFRENRKTTKARTLKWEIALKAGKNGDFETACQLWKEFTEEYPENFGAFYNWGNVLYLWAKLDNLKADEKLRLACEKFQKATEINNDCYEVFQNWGVTLVILGDLEGQRSENLFQEACEKFQEAADIKRNRYEPFAYWGIALYKWAKLGGQKAEERYQAACIKFQKAEGIRPDKYEIYCNWGVMLSDWAGLGGQEAETRCRVACEKYKIAIALKPDCHTAYNNWGYTCLLWGQMKTADEREKLFQQAEDKLLKSEKIKQGSGAYNLACLLIWRGDEEKCREWLKVGEEAKALPTRKYALKDESLTSVRDKDWFQTIHWKGVQ